MPIILAIDLSTHVYSVHGLIGLFVLIRTMHEYYSQSDLIGLLNATRLDGITADEEGVKNNAIRREQRNEYEKQRYVQVNCPV